MYLLAADIGGTKTRLAIYPYGGDPHEPLQVLTFSSRIYSSFEAIIREVLHRVDQPIRAISVGVAGPIIDGRVDVTNLPWELDPAVMEDTFEFDRVILLNDLVAVANAVPILKSEDLLVLNPGEAAREGALAVIAPGTGLGEAYLTWDGQQYRAHPSEGGHVDFAPTNQDDQELLRFMRTRYEHVSYERLCSGLGMPNIYDYLAQTGRYEEPEWLRRQILEADDPAPVISRAALRDQNPSELCRATLRKFVSILGAEAGNLALKVLATGGVYVGGGIPPKIQPFLTDGEFVRAFSRKGRFYEHLREIPIYLVRNENSALMGAANFGLNGLEN
ncbi:MAG: glucokinase [Anaerolineales bacterium]|nr:glucokinase [Anaerolineales bacterium]